MISSGRSVGNWNDYLLYLHSGHRNILIAKDSHAIPTIINWKNGRPYLQLSSIKCTFFSPRIFTKPLTSIRETHDNLLSQTCISTRSVKALRGRNITNVNPPFVVVICLVISPLARRQKSCNECQTRMKCKMQNLKWKIMKVIRIRGLSPLNFFEH